MHVKQITRPWLEPVTWAGEAPVHVQGVVDQGEVQVHKRSTVMGGSEEAQ